MTEVEFSPDAAGVSRALAALGATADEVAANLRRLGCRGTSCNPDHCPVAVYLSDHLSADRVRVGLTFAWAWFGEDMVTVDLPDPVHAFRAAFDCNDKYGELAA